MWEMCHNESNLKTSVVSRLSFKSGREETPSTSPALRRKPSLAPCVCVSGVSRAASLGRSWEMIWQLPQLRSCDFDCFAHPTSLSSTSGEIQPEKPLGSSCFTGCHRHCVPWPWGAALSTLRTLKPEWVLTLSPCQGRRIICCFNQGALVVAKEGGSFNKGRDYFPCRLSLPVCNTRVTQ